MLQAGHLGDDFNLAAALIREAFATNAEASLDYNAEFLASCYRYPGADRTLSPAFFEGDRMVSMLASFPRRLQVGDRQVLVALLTFNSVHPEFRGQGLGVEMVRDGTDRARRSGYDGVVFYCVEGNLANRTSVAGVRKAGAPCEQVFTLNYLMGLPRAGSLAADAQEPDADTFVGLSQRLASRLPLSRVWNAVEARWELSQRFQRVHHMLSVGNRRGIISGYMMADTKGANSIQVEDVLWDELNEDERQSLLDAFLAKAAGSVKIVSVPLWNYIDYGVFRKARFRQTARKLNVYLSLWNGVPIPASVEAMYLDVL